jgi:hypothetical protein
MRRIVGIPVTRVQRIPRSQLLGARGRLVRKRVSGDCNCLRLAGLDVEAWRCGCS